jgi:hypothetical protein
MSSPSRFLTLPGRIWQVLKLPLAALDRGLAFLAIPFGVTVRQPVVRYAILLGAFGLIYLLAPLPVRGLPLGALGAGYVGVLAIGRAWVLNEKQRTAIAKKLAHGDPDVLPDLRGAALVSALQLLLLFPLLFREVQRDYGLFAVHGQEPTLGEWFWFAVDKTYLKALPDWSVLYQVHISWIDFASPWGRHLVLLTRLTFDYLLIQGLIRLLAIRATVREAVAAVKTDPDVAVRLGRRAIGPLTAKLGDPDKGVRGAAANALTQLGDERAIASLVKALKK